MSPRNQRIVDLNILENNMRTIRAFVRDQTKIMAVVKADGYGHGAVKTAAAALRGGAEMLAVASVSEGKQLREADISAPILVLGAVTEEDAEEGVRQGLIQSVCSSEMVKWCEKAALTLQKQTEVHLKIDTGMGRIGVRNAEERDAVLKELHQSQNVRLSGAYTHFADADGDEKGILYTRKQYEIFLCLTEPIKDGILRHCCNSAAIHRFPEMALDMVRAGISLYGYPPVRTGLPLYPCMTWTAKISYIKELPAGTFISYGRTYCSEKTVRVATVTCGYGDGYHRAAGSRGFVLIHGQRARILGRVCMDQFMIDITGIDDTAVGDEVTLIGQSGEDRITAEDLASWAGTISYEILLSAANRVERIYR